MKSILGIVSFIALLFFVSANIYSQNWSEEQLEVWAVVEKSWDGWKNGDTEALLSTFHEEYQGWSNRDQLPMSKALVKNVYEAMSSISTLSNYMINPARIVIAGNAAVVDYVFEFSAVYTSEEGDMPYNVTGKNAEFYVKEGGEWLLLGDMTIMNSSDEDD